MIIVSIKYAGFIMRAHNRGDGGIMALAALLQRHRVAYGAALVTLGIFGAALFFADGIIAPSISVLGSLQGLKVAAPGLAHLVVPLSVVILIALFFIQRHGSGTIGWLFGPVILVWFVVIGLLGLSQVIKDPAVLQGLSPTWGVRFLVDNGVGRISGTRRRRTRGDRRRGALCRPGAFRRRPDPAWLVRGGPARPDAQLPGPGRAHPPRPEHRENPFYLMAPGWAQYPLLFLATAATIIASQAAISGSFSVARQAVQLGFLPRLAIRHPSKLEGQIYVPIVNWGLCVGVVALTLVFRSADRLGDIYGVAVTGTFILNTVLFLAVARFLWGTTKRRLAPIAVLFLTVEVAFFSANIAKVEHGAWLSLAIALVLSIVMITWRRGQVIVTRKRTAKEGPLVEFLDGLARQGASRRPGSRRSRFPQPHQGDDAAGPPRRSRLHQHVPQAGADRLRRSGQHPARRRRRAVHRRAARRQVRRLACDAQDRLPREAQRPKVAEALSQAGPARSATWTSSTPNTSSRGSRSRRPTRPRVRFWRKRLFIAMARNAASPVEAFKLPTDRTVIIGSQIAL